MSGDLELAYQRLSAITGDVPPVRVTASHHEALIDAVAAIGHHDGFEVPRSFPMPQSESLPIVLQQLAMASDFRIRQVALEGDWWHQEGPSLLVWDAATDTPMAAIWSGRLYRLYDPGSGNLSPLDPALAASIDATGFQLYPGLPRDASLKSLATFSLNNSRGTLRAIVIASILTMLVGLVVPIATAVVVSTAIPDGRLALLHEMALLVGAGTLGIFAFGATRALLTIRLETMINVRLQGAVWDRVLRLPSSFFRRYATGDLVRRVLAVDEVRRLLTGTALGAMLTGPLSVVSFLVMLLYDARLALFGIAFAAAAVGCLVFLAWRQYRYQSTYRTIQGEVTARILGLLGGIDKLRLAAAEERGFAQWSVPFAEQQRTLWRMGRIRVLQLSCLSAIGSLGILGAILVAGLRSEPISLAAFAAFNAAFGQFVASISSFGLALGTIAMVIPLFKRAMPVLGAEPEVTETASDPGRLSGRISLSNVSFRFTQDGPPVLDDVSFTIDPGEFVALVGPSGAGKSTILRLLLGLERPVAGTVFYDEHDLSDLDLRLVRRQIGTVMQSVGVLPGSIYENIAGARMLSDEEVMEAARKASFADDIRSFPMGLDTFVAEGGSTLSGGQCQRLMIARAFVGNPSIILLDEATSALDNREQAAIQESIGSMNATRLVIAHRLSTIKNADKILVLERGRIVEIGTYDRLMEAKAAFYRLAKRQII